MSGAQCRDWRVGPQLTAKSIALNYSFNYLILVIVLCSMGSWIQNSELISRAMERLNQPAKPPARNGALSLASEVSRLSQEPSQAEISSAIASLLLEGWKEA